ncbi:uncharacterized protein N7459_009548 [Penicillium hispanicum]|uniref:uncharacterized protein n=1 Tax=Penicillium hispanicum TaxID=1080232 RepID=UPI00254002CA|nr:uncharacterized protein N7459_009548 [Penicillium hispanicum]KAJ5570118.1 hypothetical protein N7459_009548 [Penicillium hispanicum]
MAVVLVSPTVPADSRDPDGDSSMASSADADSLHNDSDGAGAATGTRTPTDHAQASSAAAGRSELSPPASQSQQIPGIPAVNELKDPELDVSQIQGMSSDPPIAQWKTKRAQEEYQRAMEHVVDLDFSLDEFGDPFDERDMEEEFP